MFLKKASQIFNLRRINLLASVLLIFSSCGKDEVEEQINLPPGAFIITISEVSNTTANITWSAAVDPEKTKVSYALYLNNTLIVDDFDQNTYTLQGLEKQSGFEVKIVASDSSKKTSQSIALFTTSEESMSDFTVSVVYESFTGARVSWTGPNNIDETITYEIYLSGELITDGTFQKYDFYGLENDTQYEGEILIKMANGTLVGSQGFTFTTKFNDPPTAFEIELTEKSFYSFAVDIKESTDPDGLNDGKVRYELFIDNVNVTEELYGGSVDIGFGRTTEGGLTGNTAYEVKVLATDANNGKTFSNTLTVITNASPTETFEFTIPESSVDRGNLSFGRVTIPAMSNTRYSVNFYFDGVKYSGAGVYSVKEPDGSRFFDFNDEDVPQTNKNLKLDVELVWTTDSNRGTTYTSSSSNENFFLRINDFTETSSNMESVTVYGPNHAFLPLQFVVKFTDDKISEFEDYEIREVVIGEFLKGNYFVNQIGAQNDVSLSGSISIEEFNAIRADGIPLTSVATIDETGHHYLKVYSAIVKE